MLTLDFSNLSAEKASNVQAATEAKKTNMGLTPAAQYLQSRIKQEEFHSTLGSLNDGSYDVKLKPIEENLAETAARGLTEGVQGTLGLGYGLAAGTAAVAESVLGEGGLSTSLKKSMVEKYVENEQDMAQYAKPEDSLTYSYNKAKEGDYGAMLSWASHGTGYVASQLATMLTGAGIIAGGTKMLGKKAVGSLMSSLVTREAERLAVNTTEKVVTDALLKEATKTITSKVGTHLGLAATGFGMEGGEIMGGLAKQSVIEDRNLTGAEIGKGLTATALAGAVEYTENLLGLGAITGKLGKAARGINKIPGKLARGALTAGEVGIAEAGQEGLQTAIERWGKGQEVTSKEGIQEIIDSAGLGALGGGPVSIGGLVSKSDDEQKAANKKREEKLSLKPQNSPGWNRVVKEAAKTQEGVDKYANPESPEHNPTTAINVIHERVKRDDVSPEEKIKTGNDAIKLFQDMYKEQTALKQEYAKATDEQLKTEPEKYTEIDNKIKELDVRIKDTTPIVQAIAQPKDTADPEQLLKDFRNAFVKEDGTSSGNLTKSIRNVFGSKASNSVIDSTSEGYVDIEEQLSVYKGVLKDSEVAEVQAGAKLQKSSGAVLQHLEKNAGRVNTDILEGSPEGDFKGISQHLNGITIAVDSGNLDLAESLQSKLSEWADKRNHRAEVFEGMVAAFEKKEEPSPELQREFDILSQDRERQVGEPLSIHYGTRGLTEFMRMEATALQDAANYGQKMIETQFAKPDTMEVGSQATTPLAPAQDTIIPTQSTPDKAGQGVGDAINSPDMETTPIQDTPRITEQTPQQLASSTGTPIIADKEQTLLDMGFKEEEVQQLEPDTRSWYASQKDTPVKELEAELWGVRHEGNDPITEDRIVKLLAIKKGQTKSSPSETPIDTPEVKTMSLPDATLAFNTEVKKPFKFQNKVLVKELRDHIQTLRGSSVTSTVSQKLTQNKRTTEKVTVQIPKQYKGKPVREVTEIPTKGNRTVPIIMRNTPKEILFVPGLLEQKWKDKSWSKPAVLSDGSTATPLPSNLFKTKEDLLLFMLTHETFHDSIKIKEGETRGSYEDRINEKALISLGYSETQNKRTVDKPTVTVTKKLENTSAVSEKPSNVKPKELTTKHPELSIRGLKETGAVSVKPAFEKSVQTFRSDFNKALDYIFKPVLDERFIDDDPIQYLVQEDGKLPDAVKESIMATAYKWLATQASGYVSNDMNSMKKILHLENEDADLTSDAQAALRYIGVQANYPTEALGKEAYKLLGIKTKDNADYDLKDRMEQSLGSMIIATLEQMQFIHPTYVYSGSRGTESISPFGFDGLIAKQEDPYNPIFANVTNKFQTDKKFVKAGGEEVDNPLHTLTFYQIASQKDEEKKGALVADSRIKAITKAWGTDKQAWEKIYTGEQNTQDYSWKPRVFAEDFRFLTKRAKALWTEKQTDNLIKNSNTPWVANAPVLTVFLSLDHKAWDTILGKKDPETEHITEHETNIGINRSLDTSMESLDAWLVDAASQEKGYASEFYIPAEPWKQERMGMNSSITPQGDKAHRAFFNMKDWHRTMDLNNEEQYKMFMLGIGLYLDIEFTKEGGLTKTLEKTEDKLKDPVIQEGIAAIRSILTRAKNAGIISRDIEATDKESAAIAAAVAKGEAHVESLKALVEYTRYQMAKDSKADTFETTMTIEIDGTANGPAWGRWQFMTKPENALLHLAALQTGGFRFHENKEGEAAWDLSEHLAGDLNHDAYQVIGFAWAVELMSREQYLSKRQTDTSIEGWQQKAATKDINKMQAFRDIMGDPINSKTGNVSKEMRKLSKPPTMKTMYSMGQKKLTKELINTTIETIHQKAKKARNDLAILDILNKEVFTLTDTWMFPVEKNNGEFITKAINEKDVRNTKLSATAVKNLSKHIEFNQGKTMYEAVKKVFTEIKQSTQTLNKGLSLATVYYNTMRKGYIQQALSKSGKSIISNKEVKEIDDKLKNLYPQIQGAGGSFLPMASMDDRRAYSEKHPIIQRYQKYKKKDDTPTRKTTYPHQIVKLSDPGVSGSVLSVQHLDAANANMLMEYFSFLNNHDGFTCSIFDAQDLAKKASELFQKINANYSVSQSIADLLKTSQKVYEEKAKLLAKEFPEFDTEMEFYNELTQQSIGKKSEEYLDGKNKTKYKQVPIELEEVLERIETLQNDVDYVAKANQEEKQLLSKHVQGVSQFALPGGEYTTKNPVAKELYGIDPAQITAQRTEVLNQQIKDMQGIRKDLGYAENKDTDPVEESIKEVTLGSQASDMSTDPADYKLEWQINNQTVVDLYESIKNTGTNKVDSPVHDTHLKRILTDIVQEVIQPLDLFLKDNSTDETMGKFDAEEARVFISNHSGLLNQGISMSTGEVYTHELVHAVIHKALSASSALRSRVSRLYDTAFKEMQRKYAGEEFKAFLADPTIDVNDPANLPEVELAQARYDYLFRTPDKQDSTKNNAYTGVQSNRTTYNHLDEFMAHALTNENFSNFLQGIKLSDTKYASSTWKDLKGKNIQESILHVFQAIMDFFRGRFTEINKQNALQEAEALARALSRIQSKHKTKQFEVLRKAEGLNNKLHEKGNDFVKAAFRKVFPKAETWKHGFNLLMEDPSKGGQLFREFYNKVDAMDQGIIKTTFQEARGTTSRLADYYQMLTRRKRILDSAKESFNHAFTMVANSNFKKEPTPAQKVTLNKAGLKPDAVVLLDSLGMDKLKKVYQDDAIRQQEIDKIIAALSDKQQFPKTVMYSNYYDRAAMALGDFIIHSQFREGEDAGLNAQLIAELSGTDKAGDITKADALKVTPLIDQLTSLYAIGSLSKARRMEFTAIIDEDAEGVSKTLQLHKTLKEQAKKISFEGAERLFIKGYTEAILNSEVELAYGTLQDEADMLRAGFTRSPKPLPRDEVDPYKNQDIYLYTARTGRLNNLAPGILSYRRNRAKGTSSKVLAEQTDTFTAEGRVNTKKIIRDKQDIRNRMFTQRRSTKAKLTNNMIAKVDRAGNTIEYRYMMSEATKDAYLDQVNDFDVILGAMASQIVDKKVTPKINKELIQRLKQTYDEEYQDNPQAFVQIGPNASDPEMVEQYYMIPDKTRRAIPSIWGGHGTMYVPKDLMTLAFGYRKYSLVDAFNKKPGERMMLEKMIVSLTNYLAKDSTGKTGRGVRAFNNIEQVATELTHYAKDNIVVKSLTITLGNFGSNLMYLKMRGVPTTTILKHGWEAVKWGTQYQADIMKVNTLGIEKIQLQKENTPEAKRRLRIVEKELMQAQDAISRNPVADSIDSGFMPSLIDDIDTQGQKNFFPGRIEKFVDAKTQKLPKPLKTAGKVLFLSQDTEAYKVLNNGVKLTDFVGRHVLYTHYTKTKGMDPKEAAQKVIEEFINFDIPSHRITEYLNEIGLLWFTKYATRIPMVAAKAIVDKPFDAAMSYLLATHVGLDNIVDSAIPNLGYKVGTPFTAWSGSIDELMTAQLIGSILP